MSNPCKYDISLSKARLFLADDELKAKFIKAFVKLCQQHAATLQLIWH